MHGSWLIVETNSNLDKKQMKKDKLQSAQADSFEEKKTCILFMLIVTSWNYWCACIEITQQNDKADKMFY